MSKSWVERTGRRFLSVFSRCGEDPGEGKSGSFAVDLVPSVDLFDTYTLTKAIKARMPATVTPMMSEESPEDDLSAGQLEPSVR